MKWLMLAATLSSGSAWACSCSPMEYVYPANGTTNVPTNAVLRARLLRGATTLKIFREPDDVPVDFELREQQAVVPSQLLAPFTTYRVEIENLEASRFTTGAGEDLQPPTAPVLKRFEHSVTPQDGSCSEIRKWVLTVEGGDDEVTAPRDVLLLAFADDATAPEQSLGLVSLQASTLVSGTCPYNFAAPNAETFGLRLRTVDLAGNMSELSAAHPVPGWKIRRWMPGNGCVAAPDSSLLALGLLVFIRRRGER